MNPEREIRWTEKLRSFLIRVQLSAEHWIHKFIPEKLIKLLDVDDLEEEMKLTWIEEFIGDLHE